MNHEQATTLIETQFEQGSLPPHQSQALRIHLRQCNACRAKYDRFADLEDLLSGDSHAPASQVERMIAMGVPREARSFRSIVRIAAPVLAIAAAAMIAFVSIDGASPALPEYQLVKRGGAQELRGSAEQTEVLRLSQGTRFELILRPGVPAEGAVAARAFIPSQGGVQAWDAKVESSSDGALRITATQAELPAGVDRILIAVARPDDLPSASEVETKGPWQLFEQRVEVLP
jgi:hypothetical protein